MGHYHLGKTIGKGGFCKVKVLMDGDDEGQQPAPPVAMMPHPLAV